MQDAGHATGNPELLVGNTLYSAVDSTIVKRSNIRFKSISTEAQTNTYNVAVGQDGNLYAMKAGSNESPVQLTTTGNYIYATGAL